MKPLLLAALLSLVSSGAGAWTGAKGNDTGGIIPWSPGIEASYGEIASAHCAYHNKIAFITSMHAVYGDYITFVCVFPPGYDPVKGHAPVMTRAR